MSSHLVRGDVEHGTANAAAGASVRRIDPPATVVGQLESRASAVVRSAVDRGLFAGVATGILASDGSTQIDAFGCADREAGRSIEPDSIFWIASVTKAMTSTLALILVDEGKLELDRPVAAYLPEFARPRRRGWLSALRRERLPTIADLLRHTSGLPAHVETGGRPLDRMTLEEKSRLAAAASRESVPGKAYRYSNWNHEVVGRAIEVAAGVPFADCLRERLFEPLNMRETSFRLPAERLARLALPYGRGTGGKLERRPFVLIDGPFDDPGRKPTPSFGLFSTVGDCLRFCEVHVNRGKVFERQLWSNETARLMLQPMEHAPTENSHGLAFALHAGTASIAGTFGGLIMLYSLHRAASVFLTACADVDDERLESRRQFKVCVAEAIKSRRRIDRREDARLRALRRRQEARRSTRGSATPDVE